MTHSETVIREGKAATYTTRQPHCREQDWTKGRKWCYRQWMEEMECMSLYRMAKC